MGLFGDLFGTNKAKAGKAEQTAGAATPEQLAQATKGAAGYMGNYDKATAADTAGGAAATMQRAQDAARGTAASQSDQAIAAAAKGARTGGMTPGQAALAGSAQAAGAYGQGMAQGVEQFGQNVTRQAQLGQSMNERLQNAANLQGNINMANAAQEANRQIANAQMQTSASTANSQKPGLFGQVAGTVAGIGSLFSDRRLKEGIQERGGISDSLAKIKGYAYKYKGGSRPERGVMAQELEETEAAPAVYETAQGKAIDTDRLSTINTAAIGEQARKMQDIEAEIAKIRSESKASPRIKRAQVRGVYSRPDVARLVRELSSIKKEY